MAGEESPLLASVLGARFQLESAISQRQTELDVLSPADVPLTALAAQAQEVVQSEQL
eukprot:gene2748-3382_t